MFLSHINISLPFFSPSFPHSLKINKIFLKIKIFRDKRTSACHSLSSDSSKTVLCNLFAVFPVSLN